MTYDNQRQQRELEIVNHKLDLIMSHLGIDIPPTDLIPTAIQTGFGAEIDDLIRRGKKIEAIKRYREWTKAASRMPRRRSSGAKSNSARLSSRVGDRGVTHPGSG